MVKDRFSPLRRHLALSLPARRALLACAADDLTRAASQRDALLAQLQRCVSSLPALPVNSPQYLAALRFVRELRERCRQHALALAHAEARWQQARLAIEQTRAEIRQWQRYRERQLQAWRLQAQKQAYREQDEDWLRRCAREVFP